MGWIRILALLVVSIFLTTIAMAAGDETGPLPSFSPILTDLQAPFACDTAFRVSQGHHGRTHRGWGQFAWDFSTPEGTLLTAPVDGTVRMVRDDSTRYGCDPSYGWDANYIVLQVNDQVEVLLLHLQADSALVEVGDFVLAGTPLARVGNSGWVCGTHLHLQVQRSCSSWWCPSLPATFEGNLAPARGDHLQARACPDSTPEVAAAPPTPLARREPRPSLWARFLSLISPRHWFR